VSALHGRCDDEAEKQDHSAQVPTSEKEPDVGHPRACFSAGLVFENESGTDTREILRFAQDDVGYGMFMGHRLS
jgi:hypothetical protein